MAVIMLTNVEKSWIVSSHRLFEMTTKQLAFRVGCSETTVRRVLKEFPSIEDSQRVMHILNKYGVNPEQLEVILNAPALTAANVANFLKKSNPAQLAIILTAAGLVQTLPSINGDTKPIPKNAQQSLFDPLE